MATNKLNQKLRNAVTYHQVDKVRELLEKGANPNFFVSYENDPELQPTTPLRLVIFRISDAFLTDEDILEFKDIAEILLEHGAHPEPALALAELRYGPYDSEAPSSPFMDVWHTIAKKT